MFNRSAKLLPTTAIALLAWTSPARAGGGDNTAQWLLTMPGDLFVEAVIWLSATAHMPWLIDGLVAVMNITNGWFLVGVAVVGWAVAALFLYAVLAGLKNRLTTPRKAIKNRRLYA